MHRAGIGASFPVVALVPMALELPALVTLGILAAVLAALIAYETVRFAELRDRLRHQLARGTTPD